MNIKRHWLCCASLVAAFGLTMMFGQAAGARPYVIRSLNHDVLLGTTSSRRELNRRVRLNDTRVRAAAAQLGLSKNEYETFRSQLSKAPYVVLPQHLDAMVGYSHERAYVLRDVIIPANSRGWEVDLTRGDRLTKVYMPAVCGNISILQAMRPHLAIRPARRSPRFAVAAYRAVAPPAAMPATAAAPERPAPTPAPFEVASVPPPIHHVHFPWWILLGGLAFFHGGHSQSSAPPAAIPPPVICPP
jgi:hypothetical protein